MNGDSATDALLSMNDVCCAQTQALPLGPRARATLKSVNLPAPMTSHVFALACSDTEANSRTHLAATDAGDVAGMIVLA